MEKFSILGELGDFKDFIEQERNNIFYDFREVYDFRRACDYRFYRGDHRDYSL